MSAAGELLMHPVRMRIVRALLGGRERTTSQLRDELPDVPVATLYRQIARLVQGGALEVVRQERVRGAVERTYALRDGAMSLDRDAAALDAAGLDTAFAAFIAAIGDGFGRFTQGYGEAATEQPFGFRTAAFWLSDEELGELTRDLRAALEPYRQRAAAPGRRRHHLSTVLYPDPPEGPLAEPPTSG